MSQFLNVRMTSLPASVVGPKTRWFIAVEHFGKNGCKAALTAKCLTNGKSVLFFEGRERGFMGQVRSGFLVKIGTIQCKIAAAMVAQGVAEFVGDQAEYPESFPLR